MKEKLFRRNYYFAETMLNEIDKFSVVSFGIFNNLILRNVNSEQEILSMAIRNMGSEISEAEFLMVRNTAENKLSSSSASVTLDGIYSEIGVIRPDWNVEALKQAEISAYIDCSCINPVIKPIFDKAVSSEKTVALVEDCILSRGIIEAILKKWGVIGYSLLYLSSEAGCTKNDGELYRRMLEESGVAPDLWLHIGSDYNSDCVAARAVGMSAAYYMNPVSMYTEEQAAANTSSPAEGENFDLTPSEINQTYTQKKSPSDDEVIRLENVSMMFNMSSEKIDNFKEYFIRFIKHELNFKEFWALKDVSFSIKRGEKIGIVGTNGSGKSTILKIVSGVLQCTKGNVNVKGTIAPMIELGAGFDMELSARENVFLNGAILGYSKADMESRYQDIISFAELEEFQDIAIKNYSSGMVARLGFAIATSHIPDILIIDEILSVGDFSFQNKCRRKITELTENGATVLLVSHSANDIITMCDRVIWLNKGNMCADGEAQYIVEKYIQSQTNKGDC